MKKNRIAICFILFSAVLLASCSGATEKTIIEMELTNDYDTSNPFVHEKLFYVSDDIKALTLDISFQMEGDRGILEIADNETKQVFWSDTWNGSVDTTTLTVSLDSLEKEKEYVITFTGTGITYAKIAITSENNLVKEREKPLKPTRG